jgi:fatty acid desaturase
MDIYFFIDPWRMLLLWFVPFIVTSINIGFFAWLTHAPARKGPINGSFNTIGRIQNLFMHNQGYHLIHHMYPGVHWTRIPDRLKPLLEADDDLFVDYWVLLPSAWRVALPRYLWQDRTGERWKQRFRKKAHQGNLRIPWMPWFGWV